MLPFRSSLFGVTAAALACLGAFTTVHAQAAGPYRIQQRFVIGGEGYWDYLTFDPATHRLYIAHQTQMDVVDVESGKLVGSVKDLKRCHAVVLLDGGKTGYLSDGGSNRVVVFDPATFATLGTIDTGKNPDGLVYDPQNNRLWAFNGAGKSASVIDPTTRTVVDTIPMPGKPEFPATDGNGTLFVNIDDKPSILRLDGKTHAITATWPLKGCDGPSGLALDREGHRLFSVCDGKAMAVTDSETGKSLAVARVGDGPDAAAFDAKHQLAFASNEDGTLSVIDTANPRYPTIQTLPTMKNARTMTLDPATGTIYTVSAKPGAMPKPTPGIAHTRPTPVPGTFTVMVIGR